MMRAQRNPPCDATEEQFWPPTSVDVVLGNARVRLLRRASRGTQVIKRAPTAADLAGLGAGNYLDLPGNALNPGCTYARDFAALRRGGRAPAVTYAHIAREPGHSGLALQFWFFYYFYDLHEGDWEGMQLAFAADTPAQAPGIAPYEIVVFQHAGGEHAAWSDPRFSVEARIRWSTRPPGRTRPSMHLRFTSATGTTARGSAATTRPRR